MGRIKYLHETNKNIIITGIPRAGKSTIAFEICKKLNYNLIQLDSIVEAMKKSYPEFHVEKNSEGILEVGKFTPFLMEYLKELNDDTPRKKGINYVIEGSDINIDEYFKYFKEDDFIIIGLCYSHRSAEVIYSTLKTYDNILDWTYYLSENELHDYADALYRRNKEFERIFKKYNMKYYDISYDRIGVFKQIESDIIEVLGRS